MASITSFTRLEPRTRNRDMNSALQARIFDPCWMLARQWQLGEFNWTDGGSPIKVGFMAEFTRINRYHAKDGEKSGYDGKIPLETRVERERVHTEDNPNLRIAAEAGLHFLRLLGSKMVKKYSKAYMEYYSFKPFLFIWDNIPGDTYLFSWDEIPANNNENEKLIKFLQQNYRVDWIRIDLIQKSADGTITISDGNNSLSLELSEEKTGITLRINDTIRDEFIARREDGKLNIYKDIQLKKFIIQEIKNLKKSNKIKEELNEKLVTVRKTTDNKIVISDGTSFIFLNLNDEKTKVTLTINDFKEEFVYRKYDEKSLRFLSLMANRTLDGSLLFKDLDSALHPRSGDLGKLPENPHIDSDDNAKVTEAAEAWLKWYKELFSEPTSEEQTWVPDRMEYKFAISGRMPVASDKSEIVLEANEYQEGRLEWHSFTINPSSSFGSGNIELKQYESIPTPVWYKGMPAKRFWEFEDAQVDFGSMKAGPEDLTRLLFIEFALIFGNDWFTVPIEMALGSLCRIHSLVVTDTFGKRTFIRPYIDVDPPNSPWRMFCISPKRNIEISYVELPNYNKFKKIFFLPPVLGPSLESPPLEEVMFLRDEMANMAWAVEHVVESAGGKPRNRFEAFQEKKRRQEKENVTQEKSALSSASVAYRLATSVPDYWTPLIPVKDVSSIKLQKAAMLDESFTKLIESEGEILKSNGNFLKIYEEEVPREGARVIRTYQYTRWIDGSAHLWIGRKKQAGKGEGSSGLRFDTIE